MDSLPKRRESFMLLPTGNSRNARASEIRRNDIKCFLPQHSCQPPEWRMEM
jgi:hypothetical protein